MLVIYPQQPRDCGGSATDVEEERDVRAGVLRYLITLVKYFM